MGLMAAEKASVHRNLLLFKVGSHDFKILADHFKPENVRNKRKQYS